MSIENPNKLNNLLAIWPQNTVAVNEWLHKQGISDQLKQKYLKSNWVKMIGPGAVIRVGDRLKWEGGVYALQTQLKLPVHVGAKTALELQGYGHYVRLGAGKIELFGVKGTKLPKWYMDYKWQEEIKYQVTGFLTNDLGLREFSIGEFVLSISTPERAVLEYLHNTHDVLDEAYYLMQGLTTLRPNVLQPLLKACTSIKVKRLFLFLAERANHPWLEGINLSNIDLGEGPRQIVKNGYLDSKYKITVPLSFKSGEHNESIF